MTPERGLFLFRRFFFKATPLRWGLRASADLLPQSCSTKIGNTSSISAFFALSHVSKSPAESPCIGLKIMGLTITIQLSNYADFLNGIDLSSKRLASGGDPTKNDLKLANAMGSLATALERITMAQDPNQDAVSCCLTVKTVFIAKMRCKTCLFRNNNLLIRRKNIIMKCFEVLQKCCKTD